MFIQNPFYEFTFSENDVTRTILVAIFRDGGQEVGSYSVTIHRESLLDGLYFNEVFYDRETWSVGFFYDILHTTYTDQLTILPSFAIGINEADYEVHFINHMDDSEYGFPLTLYIDEYFMMVMITETATGQMVEWLDLSFTYNPGITFITSLEVNDTPFNIGEFYTFINTDETTASLEFVLASSSYDFALMDLEDNVLSTDPSLIYLFDITNRPHHFMIRFMGADEKVYRYKLTIQRAGNWSIDYDIQSILVWNQPTFTDSTLTGNNYAFVRVPTGTLLTADDLEVTYDLGYLTHHSVTMLHPALYRIAFYNGETLLGYYEVEVLYTDPDAILFVSVVQDEYEIYYWENEEPNSTILVDHLMVEGVEGLGTVTLQLGAYDDSALLTLDGVTLPTGSLFTLTPTMGQNTYNLTVQVGETTRDYTLILDVEMFREVYFRSSLNHSDYEFASEINNYPYDATNEVYVLNDTIYSSSLTIPFSVSHLASNIQIVPSAELLDPFAEEDTPYTITVIENDPTFGTHTRFWIVINGVYRLAIVPIYIFH
jgi:hypothetical protein